MHRAVREALADALVHADCCGSRPAVVTRPPDRAEAGSPGDMRAPAEVALRGGVSDARNPALVRMLSLLDACGRGGR